MRTYICRGKGKVYRVEANSNASAKGLAGRCYKEEVGGLYPQGFYAMYFQARIAEPRPPGKVSAKILPEVKEVSA